MRIHEINSNIQDRVYNDMQLSLPFVVLEEGTLKIAYLLFYIDEDNDDALVITDIESLWTVDYRTMKINAIKNTSVSQYPVIVNFDNFYATDELNTLYEAYYSSLDKLMGGLGTPSEYTNVAQKLLSVSYRGLLKKFGAMHL